MWLESKGDTLCISDEQKRRRGTVMPDAIFAEPKLAEIYDLLMLAKAEW